MVNWETWLWPTWKFQMRHYLLSKGLWKYTDGSEVLPEDAGAAVRTTFRENSQKALSTIQWSRNSWKVGGATSVENVGTRSHSSQNKTCYCKTNHETTLRWHIFTGRFVRDFTVQLVLNSAALCATEYSLKAIRHKVFGCGAYAHIPDSQRKKLDKKAKKYRFVGYPINSKGYRLLNEETRNIVCRRDVIFNEANFDMKSVPSPQMIVELEVVHQDAEEPNTRQSERTRRPPTRYGFDEYADVADMDHLAYQDHWT